MELIVICVILSAIIQGNVIHGTELNKLKETFLLNLVEDNRDNSDHELTSEIQMNINDKINGFFELMNHTKINEEFPIDNDPKTRVRRASNDPLLNEKTSNIFVLKGFEKRGQVPINFPRDICLFRIGAKTFAVGLSAGMSHNESLARLKTNKQQVLTIFVRSSGAFKKIYEYKSQFLTKIDCQATHDAGFIAIVNSMKNEDVNDNNLLLQEGSVVLKVTLKPKDEYKVEILQKFAIVNQNGVRIWVRDNNVYLIYSYNTNTSSKLNKCTFYKLVSSSFTIVDDLPCQNARVIEIFNVYHNMFVFIGNYQENNGTTNAFSSIMKYDLPSKKFYTYQKIYTNAIVECKYFYLDHENQRQHFLFVGNTFEVTEFGTINKEVPSIIYKFVNDFFIPLQTMALSNVKSVLPVIGRNGEFNLLIACEDQEVQIYQYDGWKFQDSSVDYTGEAFGQGVVNMRAYDNIINGTSTIVISNNELFGNTSNIYTPIYSMKSDSSKLKMNVLNWCFEAQSRAESFDVDRIDETLKLAASLIDKNNKEANFMGKIVIENSTIKKIETKNFKSSKISFDNSTVTRFNSLAKRADMLRRNIEKINTKLRILKLASHRHKRQLSNSTIEVQDLIISDSLLVEQINGRSINDLVYRDNRKNPGITEISANEVIIKKQLFVSNKIDNIEMSLDNVFIANERQVLREIELDELTVQRIVTTNNLNTMKFNDFFALLKKKVDKKIPTTINELTVDGMVVDQLINNRNFTLLNRNALKVNGEQVVTGTWKINELTARNLIIVNPLEQRISGISLQQLVDINDTRGRIDIDQDIRFANKLLTVNKLFVFERINNINVKQGNLMILRKKWPLEQVITGVKDFDYVKLLEPIKLQGKIKSKTLEKMNPITTINQNIMLEGDYRITGPVSIKRLLSSTEDIYSRNKNLSLLNLMKNGLNLYKTTQTNAKLQFKQLIEVKENLQVKAINGKDVESFVKTNVKEVQFITAKKTFLNDLVVVGGSCDAQVINDVQLDQLNRTMLKKFSPTTQFVSGRITFNKISVFGLTTTNNDDSLILLKDRPLSRILNSKKNQFLRKLSLKNGVQVRNLIVNNFTHTQGRKVFGTDLNFLMKDTITQGTIEEQIMLGKKQFSDLKVDKLTFSEGNNFKEIINNFERMIATEYNITGDVKFPREMRIKNLHFSGLINNVSFDDISNSWLLSEGDQEFTAPQKFKDLNIENNMVLLSNTINGYNIMKIINESVWLNETQNFNNVDFENVIVKGILVAPLVNGIDLNQRVILNHAQQPQKIQKLVVNNFIHTNYLKYNILNGIDVVKLHETFSDSNDSNLPNLEIKGSAHFSYQPVINILNNVDLKELHDNVWLLNRGVTLTGDNITFANVAKFDGLIYSDSINDYDLAELDELYFSLSKDQQVATVLKIDGTVFINRALEANKTILEGNIKINADDEGFKIQLMKMKALQHNVTQNITGTWHIKKLILYGEYTGSINNLNFYDDVLHTGNMDSAIITGHKEFLNFNTNNVDTIYVNGIHLSDWFEHSVFLNVAQEQIIQGRVTIVDAFFYNDINVQGLVNNMNFNRNTVLTKSDDNQIINGSLTIISRSPTDGKISSLFIDQLHLHDGINGKNIKNLYDNALKVGDTVINSNLLVFQQQLVVGHLQVGNNIYDVNVRNFSQELDKSSKITNYQNNMEHLTKVADELIESYSDVVVELSRFEYLQSLYGVNVQKTIPLAVTIGPTVEYILVVQEQNYNLSLEILTFYKWNGEENLFIYDSHIAPLHFDMNKYRISALDKVFYKSSELLFVEFFDLTTRMFTQWLMIFDTKSGKFEHPVETQNAASQSLFTLSYDDSCFGSFSPGSPNILINCENTLQSAKIQTVPIRMASSQNKIMILLTEGYQVQIWNNKQIIQVLKVFNPICYASIYLNNKYYLAICSDKMDQSIHHGSIEIFESSDEIDFKLVQSLDLENPLKINFSLLPSGDLVLYILTSTPSKSLLVYLYSGISYFTEIIDSSTIVSSGIDSATIKINNELELLSIVSKTNEIFLIEAIVNKY